MAEEAETPPEEELILTDEVEPEEAPEVEEPTAVDDDEEVFAFGDEITDEKPDDSGLAKHLREEIKKRDRELAELRKAARPAEPEIEVGEKPTLAGCEYDEEAYETQLDEWKQRKADAEKRVAERQTAAEAQQKQWETELQAVAEEKSALAKPDADEAFETVRATLTDQLNALLIHTVEKGNRGRLIYALGQNPQRLQSLAELNGDPIRFIKAVTKLEGELRVVKRRKAPEPDVAERGSAPVANQSGAIEKKLKTLEEAADKSGDRTELIAFKKKHGLIGK